MKLRYIATVDFRKSEHTNFLDLQKREGLKMGAQDVVMFISSRGNQMVFVYGFAELKNGHNRQVLRSERLRLTAGGSWNPLMLQNYAEQVGLTLDGIKRFEAHYRKLTEGEA